MYLRGVEENHSYIIAGSLPVSGIKQPRNIDGLSFKQGLYFQQLMC